ncbi:MAG: hypothetical protein J6K20_00240, partial [Thermoguttaceae bacterium]|nr:hypothetical protein [Thermoguttaceae bacterium]
RSAGVGASVGEKAARAFGGGVEIALKIVHKSSGVEKKNESRTRKTSRKTRRGRNASPRLDDDNKSARSAQEQIPAKRNKKRKRENAVAREPSEITAKREKRRIGAAADSALKVGSRRISTVATRIANRRNPLNLR